METIIDKRGSTKSPSHSHISKTSRVSALPAEPFTAMRPEEKFQKRASFFFCNTHLPGLTDQGVLHEHQEFMTRKYSRYMHGSQLYSSTSGNNVNSDHR